MKRKKTIAEDISSEVASNPDKDALIEAEMDMMLAKLTDYDDEIDMPEMDIDLSHKENRDSLDSLKTAYHKHFCGNVFPDKYSAFANPQYISPQWCSITCEVINTLEKLHWYELSLDEQKKLFDQYAQQAKNDPDAYIQENSQNVVAIMYQPIWAFTNCLHIAPHQHNLREDIVQETLMKIAMKPRIIAKYKKRFAPSTFINAVARTAIQQAYNENSGENKQAKIINRSVNAVYEALKKGGMNPNEISTAEIYQILEAKRAIPVSWQDIERALRGDFLTITHDNCESPEAQKVTCTEDTESEEKLKDFDIFHHLKLALHNDPDSLELLRFFTEDMHADMNELKNNDSPMTPKIEKVLNRLRNSYYIRDYRKDIKRLQKSSGNTKLTLGKERIPDAVFEDLAMGDIQDHIEEAKDTHQDQKQKDSYYDDIENAS